MKAMIWTRYGPPDVLQLQEVAKPTPKDDEVLIRIYATTVTAGDCELRGLNVPLALKLPLRLWLGFRKPRKPILGQEIAGEVEAVGNKVTRFSKGDQVFAWTGLRLGTYAEYTCLQAFGVLALKPTTMTYEEAATLPIGGLDALYFLKKASIQCREKVVINGAGGSIGTYAIQLAKYFGAEVTAVDSTGKLDLLRSLGADHVMDYTKEDFTKSGKTYDVIFDVVGKSAFSRSIRALTSHGRYLLGNAGLSQQVRGRWMSRGSSKQIILWETRSASAYAADGKFLTELIQAGKIHAVIDRCYPLEQTAEAHQYIETGHKQGHVVISVAQNSQP